MFCSQHEPLALLVELTPKLAKKRFRESIYQAWDYKCGYCEADATSLDHIIPRFKSGCSNRHNLIPACSKCNANKASSNMETWYQQQTFFTQAKLDRIKTWMQPDSFTVIDLQTHRQAS
jgi:hypothetical protein